MLLLPPPRLSIGRGTPWSPVTRVHPQLLQLGLPCQAWHQQQAPWRADARGGGEMKTSIHDNIKSLAPERETGLLLV